MFDSPSWIRTLSRIGTVLPTRLMGEFVGQDVFGNRYYRMPDLWPLSRKSRRVLYAGDSEASKIPPHWFGWVHGQCDLPLPRGGENEYAWFKPHHPNLTGTEAAYLPDGHMLNRLGGKRSVSGLDIPQSWQPPVLREE